MRTHTKERKSLNLQKDFPSLASLHMIRLMHIHLVKQPQLEHNGGITSSLCIQHTAQLRVSGQHSGKRAQRCWSQLTFKLFHPGKIMQPCIHSSITFSFSFILKRDLRDTEQLPETHLTCSNFITSSSLFKETLSVLICFWL